MPVSEKPIIVEHIYEKLLDAATGQLGRSVITNADIVEAIEWCNRNHGTRLSTKNPANFFKDIIRGRNAGSMWPQSLKNRGITARQRTGGGDVFEFIPYRPGQTEPFPDRFAFDPTVWMHELQSVTMPLATKALARTDESYLIQVAVRLAVVETHFALRSPIDVLEVSHLQVGIKLNMTEIDSVYSGRFRDTDGEVKSMLITAEAKGRNQRILEEQVIQQLKWAQQRLDVELAVPIAMVVVDLEDGRSGIYVVEFESVRKGQAQTLTQLTAVERAVYVLKPHVPGI